jgi:uncharacterized protein
LFKPNCVPLPRYDARMIDVVVLFFVLGLVARWVKSDLRLPEALYETLSIYLLLAIGLKGGVELSRQPFADMLPQIMACIALGAAIPFVLVPVLKRIGLNGVDSAALAAHYGSVSVVTFAVASTFLQRQGVSFEAHAALWVAVMEAPGIIAGIALARMAQRGGGVDSNPARSNWRELAHDVFFGKSVLLLAGGLVIGAAMGVEGTRSIWPVFGDLFKGVLALFLLELGLVAGARVGELKRYGAALIAFGVIAPLLLVATLAASASYIAAPTAMRIAVPEANAGLSISVALGVTFPFNIVVGIPLYLRLAQWIN